MKTHASSERRAPSPASPRAGSVERGVPAFWEKPKKLLVVDDNADMRRLIRFTLGPAYDVLEAGSGGEALRLAGRDKPRAILLDVAIPDMDGLAVLRTLRKLDPEIGVIMITGDVRMDVARSALQCGARSYITKPFDPEALRGEVGRMLDGADARPAGPCDLPWRVIGIGARR